MNNNKSFTLIEVLIAVFLLTVGAVGAVHAITRVVAVIEISSSQLMASYLAQEGIELVRNIRDTNWLEARTPTNSWDEGLTGCSGGCIADYKHSYGPNQLDPALPGYNNQFLNIEAEGFYSYSTGASTRFQRRITIVKPTADILRVTVWVGWTEKGRSYSVTAQEDLYHWLKR